MENVDKFLQKTPDFFVIYDKFVERKKNKAICIVWKKSSFCLAILVKIRYNLDKSEKTVKNTFFLGGNLASGVFGQNLSEKELILCNILSAAEILMLQRV